MSSLGISTNEDGSTNSTSSPPSMTTTTTTPAFDINRIAIIGAGPSGLAAAKHLLAEGFTSEQIDIYEQQANVGGVWNYSEVAATSASPDNIPQTDAHVGLDAPVYLESGGEDGTAEEEEEEEGEEDKYADYVFDSDEEASTAPGSGACSLPPIPLSSSKRGEGRARPPPVFPNPMYHDLHTNIPHTLMRYSDLGFTSTSEAATETGKKEKGRENTMHEDCEIFPTRQVVLEYLKEYAREVRHLIRFSTQVVDVSLQVPSSSSPTDSPTQIPAKQGETQKSLIRDKWILRSKNLLIDPAPQQSPNSTQGEETRIYDAVVVASGHYSTPYIPVPSPGPGRESTKATQEEEEAEMRAFAAAHPGVISHSKSYRRASSFAGKRVVIVGSGPSALDIAAQISAVCAPPLLISARSPLSEEMAGHLGVGGSDKVESPETVKKRVRVVGPIRRFLVEERGIVVGPAPAKTTAEGQSQEEEEEEGEEEEITHIDAIIFCTGYLYTYPFLSSLSPPLITTGRRVHNLARHFLHTAHPTLVFPGLPIKVIPFPLAEAQAAVFSRLWSNRLPLPHTSSSSSSSNVPSPPAFEQTLKEWEREDEDGKGFEGDRVPGDKSFHVFPKGGDARYINALHDWAMQARDDGKENRGKGKGKGKEPPYWGDEQLWQRSIYAQAKMQFEKTGRKAKTLEALGFSYEGQKQSPARILDGTTAGEVAVPTDIAG
ncbi:hypothetical protein F5Y17DRAFT_29374 [Xylariaceae sp. FL0594]|nr:hypothetical protein F5Y17DRAFT_29374 [Xylariaceae sp. FL0594]